MRKNTNQTDMHMSDAELYIERLITRRLDGLLTEDESLELDKILLRDPVVRRQLELSAHIDGLAAEALGAELGDQTAWPNVRPAARVPRTAGSLRQAGIVAAAACLVLWALWPTLVPPQNQPTIIPPSPGVPTTAVPNVMVNGPAARNRVELEYLGVRSELYATGESDAERGTR